MTQWEQWNNPPLPISADEAWKEMALLLDEESFEKTPMPILLPLNKDDRKKKRLVIWWVLLLGILSIVIGISNQHKIVKKYKYSSAEKSNVLQSTQANRNYKEDNNVSKQVLYSNRQLKLKSKDDQLLIIESNTQNTSYDKKSMGVNSKLGDNKIVKTTDTKNKIKIVSPSMIRDSIVQDGPNDHMNKRIHYSINSKHEDKNFMKKGFKNMSITSGMLKFNGNSQHERNQDDSLTDSFVSNKYNLNLEYRKGNDHEFLPNKKTSSKVENKNKNENLLNENNIAQIHSNKIITSASPTNSTETRMIKKDSILTKRPIITIIDTNIVLGSEDTFTSKKDWRSYKKIILSNLSSGLIWSVSLPISENNSNTDKQIIPGIWVEKGINSKSSISLTVNPYVMHTNSRFVIGNKTQGIGSIISSIKLDTGWYKFDTSIMQFKLDTSIQVNRISTLLQSFGYRIVLDYKYQLTSKWKIYCGLEYNNIVSAFINDKIVRLADGFVAKDASSDYTKGSDLWNLMQHSFFSGNVAISYSPITKISLELGIHKPLKSIANEDNNAISPSIYFLNVKLKLWEGKLKL